MAGPLVTDCDLESGMRTSRLPFRRPQPPALPPRRQNVYHNTSNTSNYESSGYDGNTGYYNSTNIPDHSGNSDATDDYDYSDSFDDNHNYGSTHSYDDYGNTDVYADTGAHDVEALDDDASDELVSQISDLIEQGETAFYSYSYRQAFLCYQKASELLDSSSISQTRRNLEGWVVQDALAICAYYNGDLDKTESIAESLLAIPDLAPLAKRLLSRISIHQHELDFARTHCTDSLKMSRSISDTTSRGYYDALSLLVQIDSLRGDESAANEWRSAIPFEMRETANMTTCNVFPWPAFAAEFVTPLLPVDQRVAIRTVQFVNFYSLETRKQLLKVLELPDKPDGGLQQAILANDDEKFRASVKHSTGVHRKLFGRTSALQALHLAAFFGQIEHVGKLLFNGADTAAVVCVGGKYQWEPLHFAVATRQIGAMRLLLQYGAPIRTSGSAVSSTLSSLLTFTPDVEQFVNRDPAEYVAVLKLLMCYGWKMETPVWGADRNLLSALGSAKGRLFAAAKAMAQFLVENGADPLRIDTKNKALPLHFASYNAAFYNLPPDLIRILLSKSPELQINYRAGLGQTPLHSAVQALIDQAQNGVFNRPSRGLFSALLENGARLDLLDNNRRTPFDLARNAGLTAIVQFFTSWVSRPLQQQQQYNPTVSIIRDQPEPYRKKSVLQTFASSQHLNVARRGRSLSPAYREPVADLTRPVSDGDQYDGNANLWCLHDGQKHGSSADQNDVKDAKKWLHDYNSLMKSLLNDKSLAPRGHAAPVKIAILDTGTIRDENFLGPDADRLKEILDFVPNNGLGSSSSRAGFANVSDEDGHGTHATYLLLEMTQHAACEVYVARVFRGRDEKQNALLNTAVEDAIAKAIMHAVDIWKVDIISMSFGFKYHSMKIESAIDKAWASKVLMLAAASNVGGNNTPSFPASHESVMCIHAMKGNCNKYEYNPSPYENTDNFAVLGACVESAWLPTADGFSRSQVKSGTSTATPVAAGIAACVIDLVRRGKPSHSQRAMHSATEYDDLTKRLGRQAGMAKVFRAMAGGKRDGYQCVLPWRWLGNDFPADHYVNKIIEQLT